MPGQAAQQRDGASPPPEMLIEDIKAACARLIVGDVQGTAYLVAPNLLITCEHVVRSAGLGGSVVAHFYQSNTPQTCIVDDWNSEADWALLRLPVPIRDRVPLRCHPNAIAHTSWRSFGFPAATGRNGVVLAGNVRDPNGKDAHGRMGIQLFCEEAAAARGALLGGGSGSPVVSQGQVVGHLRNVLPDKEERAEMGIVFACPSAAFLAMLPPQESYQPLDLMSLNEDQYRDLIYDILSAEEFQSLSKEIDPSNGKFYLKAQTINANPAGGIERYVWHCSIDRSYTTASWATIDSIIKSVKAGGANYFLLAAYPSISDDCREHISAIQHEHRSGLRVEIWEGRAIEERVYKHPWILRKYFPSRWSADYEANMYLKNIYQMLRKINGRVQPIWDNYADKRPFTDLLHIVAKQGKPFCDAVDLCGILSVQQREVIHASLQVATSLQQFLLRTLNLPQDTFLVPAVWEGHPNEKIMLHMQGARVLRDDIRKAMQRVLSTIKTEHYGHLQKHGVIAASSSWKPWTPDKHITCYVFSFEDQDKKTP